MSRPEKFPLVKIAGIARGSVLAFDYLTTVSVESRVLHFRTARAGARAAGKRLRCGFHSTPPSSERLAVVLTECGLTVIEQRTLGKETGNIRAWGGFVIAVVG